MSLECDGRRRTEVADDVVSAPLAEERHTDHHGQTVACTPCVEELAEFPPRILVLCCREILRDFVQLQLNDRGVWVAFAVVFGHDGDCFLSAVFR